MLKQMGKKQWSQNPLSLTNAKLPVILKHPKCLSFQRCNSKGRQSRLSGLGWKDLGVHRGDPLHAAACVSGEEAEWGKVLPESPIHTFHNSWISSALLARSCLNSDSWWYYFRHIIFSLDILPGKYAGTKPEPGKKHVALPCHPNNAQSLKRRQRTDKCIMN